MGREAAVAASLLNYIVLEFLAHYSTILRFGRGLRSAISAFCLLLLVACSHQGDTEISTCAWTGSDSCTRVHHGRIDRSGSLFVETYESPDPILDSFINLSPDSTTGLPPPRVEDPLAGMTVPDSDTTLMVTLRDTLHMPQFPEPIFRQSPSSEENAELLRQSNSLVSRLTKHRVSSRNSVVAHIDTSDFQIVEQFWLINAFVIKTNQKHFKSIVEHPDFLYLDAVFKPTPPLSQDAIKILAGRIRTALRDTIEAQGPAVGKARDMIKSDAYYDIELLQGGWVGLIDTGVNPNHYLFNTPSSLGFRGDCVNGESTCFELTVQFDPNEACGYDPHATSSAAIITANSNLGHEYRGVSNVTLDSYRVFECLQGQASSASTTLNHVAAVRGIQAAVRALDKIVVGELQGDAYTCQQVIGECRANEGRISWGDQISLFHGFLSHAADRAFDAGAVFVSAIGNTPKIVAQPGNGHRVISVGYVDTKTKELDYGYGYGPTSDGRLKPDIIAPSNTVTANGLTAVWMKNHTASSGATPYVAGSAALLRNWLKLTSHADTSGWERRSVEPGQVYAQLILAGQNTTRLSDSTGAGLISLPSPKGDSYWGKTVLDSTGMSIDIPLTSALENASVLDGALWWPEGFGSPHNYISLHLVDKTGSVLASSENVLSVFQRARVSGMSGSQGWSLRIQADNLQNGAQVVYWAAHMSPDP